MTAKLKWLITLGFVVVFAAGIATGVFADAWRAKQKVVVLKQSGTEEPPPRLTERMIARFDRELELTPEQLEQTRPIFEETARRLHEIREETGRRVRATMTESHEQLAPFLTPEQREHLKQMKPHIRHRMKFRHRGRPPRGGDREWRQREEQPENGS
jgi:Spy/CpxP family protein refolding chaperone